MTTPIRATVIGLIAVVAAACSGAASPSPSPSAAQSSAPSVATSAATSPSASPSPSGLPSSCQAANLTTVTSGKLTIGTDNPAYPPYYQPPATGKATAPWQLGDPTDGQGFESAVAYAIAEKLGFSKDSVAWIVVPFANSYAPGAKKFDLDKVNMGDLAYVAAGAEGGE